MQIRAILLAIILWSIIGIVVTYTIFTSQLHYLDTVDFNAPNSIEIASYWTVAIRSWLEIMIAIELLLFIVLFRPITAFKRRTSQTNPTASAHSSLMIGRFLVTIPIILISSIMTLHAVASINLRFNNLITTELAKSAAKGENYYLSGLMLIASNRQRPLALSSAVTNQQIDTVKLLLKLADEDKDQALALAIRSRNLDIIELLLNAGANMNIRTEDRSAPICNLIYDQPSNNIAAIIDKLLQHGLDINAGVNYEESTILMLASEKYNEPHNQLLIKRLLAAGADVNRKNKNGETLLFYAIRTQDLEYIKSLLAMGADVNSKTTFGDTPLSESLTYYQSGASAISSLLIAAGADVNVKNSLGRAPLLEMVRFINPENVKLLLAAGADINIIDNEGNNILFLLLQAYQAFNGDIRSKDCLEFIRLMLAAGIDLNARNAQGDTALEFARKNNLIEPFNILKARE